MEQRLQLPVLLLIAALATGSMWFYIDKILVAHQVEDAAMHDRPRGNLSDLYPRWLGARELLLHHRNPYGDDITREIQKGYYGRVLRRPDDPEDQEAFAYPAYTVFLLAPLIGIPFHDVEIFFYCLLIAVTAASVVPWLSVLRWKLPPLTVAATAALLLGSVPAVQGIKLEQLSPLVAAVLAAAAACVANGFLVCGGFLLALATIKPHLALPLAGWLLLWAFSDWKSRRRFVYAFAGLMAVLVVAAEIVLPGWIGMFWKAVEGYHTYTHNELLLKVLVPWGNAGKILAACALLISAWLLWRFRKQPAGSQNFGNSTALVTALTVLIIPMYAPYNQILLLPAVLALARDRAMLLGRSRAIRFLYVAAIFALSWQWIASLVLSGIYLADRPLAIEGWKWPFLGIFTLPVLVFALMLVDVARDRRALLGTV